MSMRKRKYASCRNSSKKHNFTYINLLYLNVRVTLKIFQIQKKYHEFIQQNCYLKQCLTHF